MDEVEGRLQVDGNHGVPLLLAHAEHQAVLGDAGVVDQNVDGAELLLHLRHHLLRLLEVSSVRGIALGLHAQGGNLVLGLSIHFQIGERDVSAFSGELQGNGLANAACCASNQRSLTT